MVYTYVMSKEEMVDSRACLHNLLNRSSNMEVSLNGRGRLYFSSPYELDDWLDDVSLPDASYEIRFFKECDYANYF